MRTLYIDCGMGAAGDMLTAALLELLPDREGFLNKLNHMGLPGVTVSAEKSVKCGITGTHIRVSVHGTEEDEHLHDHSHSHSHGSMDDIRSIVSRLRLPAMVKLDVLAEELRCYPQQFSAWFITAFPMVYRHIKEGER